MRVARSLSIKAHCGILNDPATMCPVKVDLGEALGIDFGGSHIFGVEIALKEICLTPRVGVVSLTASKGGRREGKKRTKRERRTRKPKGSLTY